jgi:hypothetical protein
MTAVSLKTALTHAGHALAKTGPKTAAVSSCLETLSAAAPKAVTELKERSAAVLTTDAALSAHAVAAKHFERGGGAASGAGVALVAPKKAISPKHEYFKESGRRLVRLKENLDHMAQNRLNLIKKDESGNTTIEFKGVHFTHSGVTSDVTSVTHYFSPIKHSIAFYSLANTASLDASLKAYLLDPAASFDAAKFSDLCLNVLTNIKGDDDESKIIRFVIGFSRNLSDKLDALRPATVIDSKYFTLDKRSQSLLDEFKGLCS